MPLTTTRLTRHCFVVEEFTFKLDTSFLRTTIIYLFKLYNWNKLTTGTEPREKLVVFLEVLARKQEFTSNSECDFGESTTKHSIYYYSF